MSNALVKERSALAGKYAKANEAIAAAQKRAVGCKSEIIKFDKAHPEIMKAVAELAGNRKREARQKQRAAEKDDQS